MAAAERCNRKETYAVVRDKWTIKCSDAIYGKVLQLLTLAVYATQDFKGEHGIAATAAASALESFVLEESFLPSSESAFGMYSTEAPQGTKMPCLVHVLLDIYYANDPLDASSKHWVLWLVEQFAALSTACSDAIASYRASNAADLASSASSSPHSSNSAAEATEGTPAKTTPVAAAESKALSARDKAMQAMKEKAAQFALMMEGMSDTDSDEEDGGGGQAAGMGESAHQGMKSSNSVVAVEMRDDTKATNSTPATASQTGAKLAPESETVLKAGGAETTAMEISPASGDSPVKSSSDSPLPVSDDDVPVCIVCQADANAEDSTGNLRVLGYLALVQASTVLQRAVVDGKREMHVLDTVPGIHAKVAPRRPAMEGNAHLSFCGHCKYLSGCIIFSVLLTQCAAASAVTAVGMHQDCFQTYLTSQLRKAAEQSEMVLDQTKHQFCCPLCKKLGNLFVPSVETDALQMEAREAIRMKLAAALRRKQATQQGEADSTAVPGTTSTTSVAYRPDMTEMPKPWVSVLPTPAQRVAQAPKLQESIAEHCWSWLSWIRHPSLVNSDLGVFYKYATASNAPAVSFGGLDGEDGLPLKRARSQTSDSADLGRISSKMNTSPDAPPFPPLPGDAEGAQQLDGAQAEVGLEQTQSVSMGETNSSDEDESGTSSGFVPFITAADAMSYSLNDIDLNSVSTERRVQASVALEEELRGITIEAAPSLDEWDDGYQSLSEAGFGSQDAPDPVRELELHRRKEERVLEAIRNHSSEHVLCDYVKRRAWGT